MTRKTLNNESCALFLFSKYSEDGLDGTRIVRGTLLAEQETLYFEKDEKEGFPIPDDWLEKLYSTPPEKKALFRGCSHFILVDREEAKKHLEIFQLETRWDCWCPTS